jgi:flagellar hook assembly protein FlgD
MVLRAGPNPLDARVTFDYVLPAAGDVRLAVYDVRGQHVATLVEGRGGAGAHTATWDTRDSRTEEVAGGVYFVRLVAGGEVRTLKILVAR